VPGIYISYPFCAQKCTYCNFASGVFPRELESRYRAALLREIAARYPPLTASPARGDRFESAPPLDREQGPAVSGSPLTASPARGDRAWVSDPLDREQGPAISGWKWTPDTVYLGGGTPSSMAPDALREILASLPGRPWTECTIEAAPGTVTAAKAEAWRDAGVNRVSLGVQSFVERELKQTGRKHRAGTVAADVETLRTAGIANLNIDLIAGLPFQTEASWRQSLEWIVRLDPPHVSIYMLEVDPDSRLGLEIIGEGSRYGAKEAPSEDLTATLYETAVEFLEGHGTRRYEISNFAKPGFESRHNLKYWRLEPYVGFGSDAHSFDGLDRWQNVETVEEYCSTGDPRRETTESHPREEKFFVGLRLLDGVTPDDRDWTEHGPAIRRFLENGLLEQSGPAIRLTNRGVLLSNEVFQEFLHA
jgi:oxygen-independent coproporphyrinogen-3 oxidase